MSKEVECFVCNMKLKIPSLSGHFKKDHPNEERVCERCKRLRNCYIAKLYNNDICIACDKKIECDQCKQFYQKSYIEKHKIICDGKDNAERTCKKCGIKKSKDLFYETKYTCIACLTITEKCDICQKDIIIRNMKRHKQSHNEDNKEKEKKNERHCNKCKENKSLEKFSMGKYTCKDCLKQRIQCTLCNKTYSFRYEREHKLRYHTDLILI